jgi:hypothetical protein
MTEADWLACADSRPMLDYLRGKASDRKLRLFAVACCRRAEEWHVEVHRRALDEIERYMDHRSCFEELMNAVQEVQRLWMDDFCSNPLDAGIHYATNPFELSVFSAVRGASATIAAFLAWQAARIHWPTPEERSDESIGVWERARASAEAAEHASQGGLLRDIFHGPCRPVHVRSSWRDHPDVARLSRVIYEDRAFDLMPILGDAIEAAGCDSADILSHCRAPGDHVRGCWVVDAILGKW